MKSKALLITVIGLLLAAFSLQAQENKQPKTDSVFIFKDKSGIVSKFDKKNREVGEHIKHLQITNLLAQEVEISLSLDLKQWTNFTVKSPEKKIFVCDGIDMMYIIINPKSAKPERKKIYRDKKYELYITSYKTVSIKEII